MQLRNDDTLRTVDYERTSRGHIRDIAQVHILHLGVEILVLRVAARKAEFCLQRNFKSLSSLQTFLDGILWRIDEVVNELKLIVVARILNREDFLENLVKTLVLPVLRSGLKLEKVLEGLELYLEEIRIFQKNL